MLFEGTIVKFLLVTWVVLCFSIANLTVLTSYAQTEHEDDWIQLFNGKDLEGWTPKIRGYELGENFGDTFFVEDGLMKIRFYDYGDYKNRFGHLFYKESLSHYIVRIEYRFVEEQCPGGPGWAKRNSGIMLHCQDPESMAVEQDFPVSIEMQMLGGDGVNERHTANLCTPGTNVEMDGKLILRHCVDSSSETYHLDDWVTIEVEVRGDEVIRHKIDDKVVLEYNKPQYDKRDPNAKKLIKDGELSLSEGFIALQAESHPLDIRKVELKKLKATEVD